MASSKPTLLLIHGAWHPPACYDKLRSPLEAMGYEYICPHLPTLGPNSHGIGFDADVEAIRTLAVNLFGQRKKVVLIAHSAGGGAAVGLSALDTAGSGANA
jgi:pimeloyl-ACP methyl ester carboxylesterase